ncbi:unnamed protein product [Polarella glacialis]|uniref:Reverse transcriptase domain-containing protein n=1 Tax=Polarella glacialis TaxID=89957 RepID=A0A813EHD4_POLGL|nr:unnamed protein product [Polarella glacialis]
MADVFDAFYAELLRCASPGEHAADMRHEARNGHYAGVPRAQAEEIRIQLKSMLERKAADTNNVVVEMLKSGGKELFNMLAELFTDVLDPAMEPPEFWKLARLKVLFKKGDAQQAENYRPIAIFPVLYKVFSRVLLARIKQTASEAQSVDQAGFRSGFCCDDHLFSVTLIWEMMNEFQLPLFVAAVDFKKVFDAVTHAKLWETLREQGVEDRYVHTLERLYSDQNGQVLTDTLSKTFSIRRGTKQGDPTSPVLFNAVLEKAMRKAKQRWDQKGFGIEVEPGRLLQNLRFADDALPASSLSDLQAMLTHLAEMASEVASKFIWERPTFWRMLPGNNEEKKGRTVVSVNNKPVEFLPLDGSTMYLGRLLTLGDFHGTKIQHRISRGWKMFWSLKRTLCDKGHSLRDRLKLFEATVSPTVLYGSGTWTMTA